MRTSAAMTAVYAANPAHKRVCQAAGGVRGLLKFTPSLEVDTPAAGGDNPIQSVSGEANLHFYDSVLGEQLRVGKFNEFREEPGAVVMLIHEYERSEPKQGWGGPLVPLFLDPGSGVPVRAKPEDSDVDPIVHEVPVGYC